MKHLLLILLALAALGLGARNREAGASVTWEPSSSAGVTNYTLYYGIASGVYTNAIQCGLATNVLVRGLANGKTYFFVATAMNNQGLESDYSAEAVYRTPGPDAPGRIVIQAAEVTK